MGVGKMNKKEEAVKQLKNCEDMHIWVKPIKDYIKELEAKEERAKKEHKLLGLKNEQLSIFQFERNHFCSMTDESYERLKALDLQIKQLEEELK